MNQSKTTVIYHSADYDGIFCREIAKKHFGDRAIYVGWNFGDPILPYPNLDNQYVVLDLPCDAPWGKKFHPDARSITTLPGWEKWVWIDHHKSSIDSHPQNIPGYRIDGVAACRLAWQWFESCGPYLGPDSESARPLPDKNDYVNRNVIEPISVRLAGEYDIWDKRDPDAETFQYALRVSPLTPACWSELFNMKVNETVQITEGEIMVRGMLVDGRVAQSYAQLTDSEICKSRTWLMDWEGLKFLCVNSARFNSQLFSAKDIPETGHDALLGFCFNGKVWTVSLYHAKHRTDLDLSEIAIKHGGGGHRGACGFTCDKLPFL